MAKNQLHFNIRSIQIFKAKLRFKLLTRRRRYFYGVLSDPDGYVSIKADEILKDLFNETITIDSETTGNGLDNVDFTLYRLIGRITQYISMKLVLKDRTI